RALAVSFAIAFPAHSFAAVDAFLKLDGVEGESTDAQHKDEIVIESWSFGASNRQASNGQQTSSRPCLNEITLTKHLDKASTALLLKAATGVHIPMGVITVRKAGAVPLDYLFLTLQDIIVTSVNTVSGNGDRPEESISLNFATLTVAYT